MPLSKWLWHRYSRRFCGNDRTSIPVRQRSPREVKRKVSYRCSCHTITTGGGRGGVGRMKAAHSHKDGPGFASSPSVPFFDESSGFLTETYQPSISRGNMTTRNSSEPIWIKRYRDAHDFNRPPFERSVLSFEVLLGTWPRTARSKERGSAYSLTVSGPSVEGSAGGSAGGSGGASTIGSGGGGGAVA